MAPFVYAELFSPVVNQPGEYRSEYVAGGFFKSLGSQGTVDSDNIEVPTGSSAFTLNHNDSNIQVGWQTLILGQRYDIVGKQAAPPLGVKLTIFLEPVRS